MIAFLSTAGGLQRSFHFFLQADAGGWLDVQGLRGDVFGINGQRRATVYTDFLELSQTVALAKRLHEGGGKRRFAVFDVCTPGLYLPRNI